MLKLKRARVKSPEEVTINSLHALTGRYEKRLEMLLRVVQ